MEPTTNQEVITSEPSAPSGDKKEGNGLKAATIICAVLALAGIGFGVYGMTRKPVEKPVEVDTDTSELESKYANLEKQYAALQNYIKKLEASGAEVPEDIKTVASDTTTSADIDAEADEYIRIEEWGIKIKISGKTKILSMSMETDQEDSKAYVRVVSANMFDAIKGMDESVTGNIPGNFIVRSKKATIDPFAFGVEETPVYNDGEYNYFTYQPTGYMLPGFEKEYSTQISKDFQEMSTCLKSSENYSKI